MLRPSSGVQAYRSLAIPAADFPHVCHAASLDCVGGRKEYIQCRPTERQERAAQYRRVASGLAVKPGSTCMYRKRLESAEKLTQSYINLSHGTRNMQKIRELKIKADLYRSRPDF